MQQAEIIKLERFCNYRRQVYRLARLNFKTKYSVSSFPFCLPTRFQLIRPILMLLQLNFGTSSIIIIISSSSSNKTLEGAWLSLSLLMTSRISAIIWLQPVRTTIRHLGQVRLRLENEEEVSSSSINRPWLSLQMRLVPVVVSFIQARHPLAMTSPTIRRQYRGRKVPLQVSFCSTFIRESRLVVEG